MSWGSVESGMVGYGEGLGGWRGRMCPGHPEPGVGVSVLSVSETRVSTPVSEAFPAGSTVDLGNLKGTFTSLARTRSHLQVHTHRPCLMWCRRDS